eukprot:Phypoly_transcript_14674.p1 GENE.Phypoly_transcript_14674~~Phypoly_transcript_14674.p1  ORF type:complete len:222 (-),score=39.54 Phypoly_transcript_14674:73-738(-)
MPATTYEARTRELEERERRCEERERECAEREKKYEQKTRDLSPMFLPRGPGGELIGESYFGDTIREWLPNKTFQLLYKASVDGFGDADFHNACDNKGSTLTVIQSTDGYLFGGYTPLSFDASSSYKSDQEMFLFTLTNPHSLPPTKYPLKKEDTYGIYCYSPYGPIFGGGHDILVSSYSHQNNFSYSNFPYSYTDTTGKGNTTFTGARNFTIREIEVFCVI